MSTRRNTKAAPHNPALPTASATVIDIPLGTHRWFLQAIYCAMIFLVCFKFTHLAVAVLAVGMVLLFFAAQPIGVQIDPVRKTLDWVYRPQFAFRRQAPIDLAPYSRIYSQIESYAGRSLHLSGPQGQHVCIGHFDQSPTDAQWHLHEVARLRQQLAQALGIHDGGGA